MNVKPTPPPMASPVESKSQPWRALRPGETMRQWHTRMSHTCYRCGKYDEDNERLDRHEARHDERPASSRTRASSDGVSA